MAYDGVSVNVICDLKKMNNVKHTMLNQCDAV